MFIHSFLEHQPNPFICLLQIGWEKCKPGHSYTNFRDFYLVHFVKSGCGELCIDNEIYKIGENEIFLIPPNKPATYRADKVKPWEYYFFAFNGIMSTYLIDMTILNNKTVATVKKENCNVFSDIILQASQDIENTDNASLYGLEILFKLLQLLTKPEKENVVFDGCYERYIIPIQRYIANNFSNPDFKISEISKHFLVDRTYLFKIFKKYTGKSIKEYLIDYRIEKAKYLLCNSELPLYKVLEFVGYSNYKSFYNTFKKHTGISPTDYKKKQSVIRTYCKDRALIGKPTDG